MRSAETDALDREIGMIQGMLDRIPPAVKVGRVGLEARLDDLRSQRATLLENTSRTAAMSLLFDGDPVKGTEAIEVGFLSAALRDFLRLIETQLAQTDEPPDYLQSARLFVTAPARGSFGVVLEEMNQTRLPMTGDSGLAIAVDRVADLIEKVRSVGFEEIDDDVDSETLSALQKFAATVAESGAEMKVRVLDREVRLSASRLERLAKPVESEIKRLEFEFVGTLSGVLQRKGHFEHLDEEGAWRYGALAPSLDPATAAKYFGRRCKVVLERITTISKPSGRTRTKWQLIQVKAAPRRRSSAP